MMLEYWVEHYHQVAHRFDVYWRGMTDIQRQAELRARRETMMKSPEIGKERSQVTAKFERVRRRTRLDKTLDSKKKIRLERDGAVVIMMNLLASAGNIGEMGDIIDEAEM